MAHRFTLSWPALAAGLLLLGCRPGTEAGCPIATPRERIYPFTGTWRATDARSLCLVQRDARTVYGRLDGRPVAGTIEPGGELVLAVADAVLSIHRGRLNGDTLRTGEGATQDGRPAGGPTLWIRESRPGQGLTVKRNGVAFNSDRAW